MNGSPVGMDPLKAKFVEVIRMTLEDHPDVEPSELVDYIDDSYNGAWEIIEEGDDFGAPDLTVIEGGSA